MKTISIEAHNISVEPKGGQSLSVDLELYNQDVSSVIAQFDAGEIVGAVSIRSLLESMYDADIIDHLQRKGYQITKQSTTPP